MKWRIGIAAVTFLGTLVNYYNPSTHKEFPPHFPWIMLAMAVCAVGISHFEERHGKHEWRWFFAVLTIGYITAPLYVLTRLAPTFVGVLSTLFFIGIGLGLLAVSSTLLYNGITGFNKQAGWAMVIGAVLMNGTVFWVKTKTYRGNTLIHETPWVYRGYGGCLTVIAQSALGAILGLGFHGGTILKWWN